MSNSFTLAGAQKMMAVSELVRRQHRIEHGCKGRPCPQDIILRGQRSKLEDAYAILRATCYVPMDGDLGSMREKLVLEFGTWPIAKTDPMAFLAMVCATLEPGEMKVLETFAERFPSKTKEWVSSVLVQGGASYGAEALVT